MDTQALTQNRALKVLAGLLQFVGPIALAIVFGYGAVKYAEGQTNEKIHSLEINANATSERQERSLDRSITREEFNQFREGLRDDIKEIKSDLRAIRSDLRNAK